MNAREIKNKVTDPDGNFRKWGSFFAPIVVAVLSVFYTKPAQDGVESGNAKLDTVLWMVKDLKMEVQYSQRDNERRLDANEANDKAQWASIGRINDRIFFTQNKTVKP